MRESSLRDLVAESIEIMEPGLRLLAKEQFIPNDLGTRGFIDLYATDADAKHVLIELKRSSQASREALHEISKYAEGVKRHFGCRDDEIRVIVASTEWKELIVPFSRFVSDTTLDVIGLEIDVSEDEKSFVVSPISSLKVAQGRYLAPWHEVNHYTSEESLQRGIEEYVSVCDAKGIEDYVLIVLDAPKGHHKRVVQSVGAALETFIDREDEGGTESSTPNVENTLQPHPHILYFVPQMLEREQCLDLIRSDPVALEEAEDVMPDMDEDELLQYLHGAVYSLEPRAHFDYYEIGYPAKFRNRLLEDEGWIVREVLRKGAFERNEMLADESILDEVSGERGEGGQYYRSRFLVSSSASFAAVRSRVGQVLTDNQVWHSHLNIAFDEIVREFSDAAIELEIFSPCTGLLTLYFAACKPDGICYVPRYAISVEVNGEQRRLYWGGLAGRGPAMSWEELLAEHYNGETQELMLSLIWGGRTAIDTDVLENAGLVYQTYRHDRTDPVGKCWIRRDDRWRQTDVVKPGAELAEYFQSNIELIQTIVDEIGGRQVGDTGMFEM